ncbi:MAG: CPBP family intramembrane metalloprotease, partial [Chloroflexi bacterium]|nr:CPBP family intramembrane metalloprotease [Chloroflexota bacterium]
MFVGSLAAFWALGFVVYPMISDPSRLADAEFVQLNLANLIGALIYAFIQTSLSEEIFFRGFLGKRLIAKLGFGWGNLIQAAVFGALHAVLMYRMIGAVKAGVIMLYTGTIGWMIGYLNEREAEGSILPGWLL